MPRISDHVGLKLYLILPVSRMSIIDPLHLFVADCGSIDLEIFNINVAEVIVLLNKDIIVVGKFVEQANQYA